MKHVIYLVGFIATMVGTGLHVSNEDWGLAAGTALLSLFNLLGVSKTWPEDF